MNWLVDEAPKRNFKLYQWTVFEMMQPCITCEALDKEPHGTDETRAAVCPLWQACLGVRARKSTGWLPLKEARDKCIRLGGPNGREWLTQGLCKRPSSHGLVLHNFEKENKPEGNFTRWRYMNELPWYAIHDPAEGKVSVIHFVQYYKDATYVFDELVDKLCATTLDAKDAFYAHCQAMGYPDPELVIVDPHRPDACADWKRGSLTLGGISHKYNAVMPDISESSGSSQLLTTTIEYLRQRICDGAGVRRLYINKDTCPETVKAIGEYHYPTDNATNNITSDTPDKAYSDYVDPLRYWEMYRRIKWRTGKTRGEMLTL